MMIFTLLSAILALFCILLSFIFFRLASGAPKGIAAALPRWRIPGALLGIICLIWSAWHACLLLEGPLERFHPVIWLLVPVTAILSFIYLDYLFTRALGGFFVLMANKLLQLGFANDVPLRPLYSTACLIIGVAGLFLIGAPWRLRDAFDLASSKKNTGYAIALALIICACVLVLLPLL